MTTYHVPESVFTSFLLKQQDSGVFVSLGRAGWARAEPSQAESALRALAAPRPPAGCKGLFLPASEPVGRYGAKAPAATTAEPAAAVLIGLRACQLRALRVLDEVMLRGLAEDPDYRYRRQATVLVSCDCVEAAETCFCPLVGGQPYPTEGFDVNLTAIDDGLLAEPASETGRRWLAQAIAGDLAEATAEQLAQRDQRRAATQQRLVEQNASFRFRVSDGWPPRLPDEADAAWGRFAADCVECGACTHLCPTCHCFYLYDTLLGPEAFERVRTWDSCLLSTYHRMAGGPNLKPSPRPRLAHRLANRVLHKFVWMVQQYQRMGCVGCGRCADGCPGAIDVRRVVEELKR